MELEAASRLNDKISVQAYYTYTTGVVHTRTFENRGTSFNNLIRRPKNIVGGMVRIEINKRMSTSVSVKSVGIRKDIFFDPDTFESLPINLLAYFNINAGMNFLIVTNYREKQPIESKVIF